MPSLQQISLTDCTTTNSTVTDIGRGMTAGSDILHKHSINSLLAEQNDIVNRGLASPIEGETISFPDLFGSNAIANGNNASSATAAAAVHNNNTTNINNNSNNNNTHMRSHQFLNVHQNMLAGSGLFAKSNIQQPCNNINGGANCIIGGGGGCGGGGATTASAVTTTSLNNSSNNFHHQSSIMSPNSGGGSSSSSSNFMQSAKTFDNNFQFDMTSPSSNTLKVLQRNLSFECNSPTNSPSTPSSYGARNNLSPLFSNGFNNFDSPLLSNGSSFSNSTNLSNSPTDYNDNLLSSLENQNFMNQMNYLTLNEPQTQRFGSGSSGSASPLSPTEFDLVRMQNLQALNTLRLLQQSQQLNSSLGGLSNLDPLTLNQLLQSCNLTNQYRASLQMAAAASVAAAAVAKSPTTPQSVDSRLDHVAKIYRSSAALNEAKCTWSGVLPPRSHRNMTYSPKVFLGGIPWDISEQSLISIFKQFGSIKVEWPGKEQQTSQPRGYVYIIFESERQVKSLLQACSQSEYSSSSGSIPSTVSSGSGNYYFKISSKKIKSKEVEVIPWIIADSNYVKSTSQKLDPTKTVFVGALHGKLTAEGLAKIMNDLFDGVIYAGLDTDKYKYPIGSGRVTFNNSRSYMRAVSAAFIEIKSSKFTKKVQVDPYLEDSLCSKCGVQHGPYYCRELVCFRYFCRTCWQVWHHSSDMSIRNHKPLTRNSKSTQIIGVGPQSSSNHSNNGTINSSGTPLMSPTTPQPMRSRNTFMKRQ